MSAGSFERLLGHAESDLWAAFERAAVFAQMGDRGSAREQPLARFLAERLPSRFGVAHGEVVDYLGNQSGQVDLMIYDRSTTCPLYREDDGRVLLPAEALLAPVEVKSLLNATEVRLALHGVARLYELRPWGGRWLAERDRGAPADRQQPRLLTSLFSYNTDLAVETWAEHEIGRIRREADVKAIPVEHLSRVAVLNRGLLLPAKGDAARPEDQSGVLALWFFSVINFLSREVERRRSFPWNEYHLAGRGVWASVATPVPRAPVEAPPTNRERRKARARALKGTKG